MNVSPALLRPLYANIFATLAADVLLPDVRLFIKKADGTYLYGNAMFARDSGLSETQLLGRNDADMAWHAKADEFRDHDLKVMQNGEEPIQIEVLPRAKSGPLKVRKKKVALYDERVQPFGIIGSYVPMERPRRRECADCANETQRLLNLALSLLSPLQMASYEEQAEALRCEHGGAADQLELT